MNIPDTELEALRGGVSCAALLERHPPPWHLDKKDSTRRCLKYRRARGEVLLVTHEGRGWWDPMSSAKGDIFSLVQFLIPGIGFREACDFIRPFIGLNPSFASHERIRRKMAPDVPVVVKWDRRRLPRPGSPTWHYLTAVRCLPGPVVAAAVSAGMLREGPHSSAWFAHRDREDQLTGIEMRGPDYRGFSPGGEKTLFRLPGRLPTSTVPTTRLVVAEAPIDAMSVAALEHLRADTLYVATAGGMGPGTLRAIDHELWALSAVEGGKLVIATDSDSAGHGYADLLTDMAAAFDLRVSRLLPTGGEKDWNDALRHGRGV